MSKITLPPVRFYDINDIYEYNVDNRPLKDISTNIDIINSQLDNLGFYQEYLANPETEPATGFAPMTVAYVGANKRLYPIDISLSPLVVDYTKAPIVLILGQDTSTQIYKALTFSSSLQVPSLFNKFLTESIGRAIKIGPGGSLVDELYFDLYYSNLNYQSIFVGKVLTPTTISFGGNQVNVLGDNRFLAKDRNDSSTGLITQYRDNQNTCVVNKGVVVNSALLSYPFAEYQISLGTSTGFSAQSPVPVYFTYKSLSIDAVTGQFSTTGNTNLNEIHFASPSVAASTDIDPKYTTAGVNVGSLQTFAEQYLLHSKVLSTSLSELSQDIATSLYFINDTNTSTVIKINPMSYDIGANLDSSKSFPENIFSNISSTTSRGLVLGDYLGTSGGFFGSVLDLHSTSVLSDSTSGVSLANTKGDTSLVLHAKNSNLFVNVEGVLSLAAAEGVMYALTPSKDFELTNKLYVDQAVLSASDTAKTKIPLGGTTTDNPVTASLYFDTTASSEPATVLKFNSLIRTEIKSSNPIEFKTLLTSDYQVLRAETPSSGDPKDLVNRSTMEAFIGSSISGAIGSNFVTTAGAAQSITGFKTFTQTTTFTNNNPIQINPTSGTEVSISTTGNLVSFKNTTSSTVKISSSPTENTDAPEVLTTKGFVQDLITQVTDAIAASKFYLFVDSTQQLTGTEARLAILAASPVTYNTLSKMSLNTDTITITENLNCVINVSCVSVFSHHYVSSTNLNVYVKVNGVIKAKDQISLANDDTNLTGTLSARIHIPISLAATDTVEITAVQGSGNPFGAHGSAHYTIAMVSI